MNVVNSTRVVVVTLILRFMVYRGTCVVWWGMGWFGFIHEEPPEPGMEACPVRSRLGCEASPLVERAKIVCARFDAAFVAESRSCGHSRRPGVNSQVI